MKKILYVSTLSGTINAFLVPHIEMLLDQGNSVDCTCFIDKEPDEALVRRGVKIYNIPFNRNPLNYKNIKAFRKILELQKENCYDIVHVHTPIAACITRVVLRKEKNLKVIYTTHGLHFYKGASIINWLLYYPIERLAAHWTDTMAAINGEDLERIKNFKLRNNGKVQMVHGVGIKKEDYLINEAHKEKLIKSLGINKGDFVVLVIAELNKNKNHIQIIKALNLLTDKYPSIKVLCAGEGPLVKKLENKICSYGLSGNISLLGFRKDIKELLSICHCVALFSKREGLGKCLLEGMIAQKPLLATNTRGARELIENGENGFLVGINDYKDTAEKLESLYVDKQLREKFSECSKEKINKYLLENVLKEINTLYSGSTAGDKDTALESNKPLVSVLMGIYNCQQTLKQSIESLLKQNYTNWELIMCDDCSKDNTVEIAQEYCEKYPEKIKLLKNEKNLTLGPTLNRCLQLTKGELIARQDGDDFSHKERLEKQVSFLVNNKEYDLVGTSMVVFDCFGTKGVRTPKKCPMAKDLMRGSIFCHATIMMKKRVMVELGGYSEEANRKQVEDYDLWFRFMAKGYKGYNLSDGLYYVREDNEAYKRKSFRRRVNELIVMKEGRKFLELSIWNVIFLLKPMAALIVPRKYLRLYHEGRSASSRSSIKSMEITQ